MSKTKVAIIGTAGIPANYGGFETLAEYLVRNLSGHFEFTVYCSSANYTVRNKKYFDAELVYWPLKANGTSSILYDAFSILHACFFADVLLILGVGGSFLIPFVRLFRRAQVVVNVDGLEWKRHKWGPVAKWYLRLQEKIAVAFAHTIIADNEGIQKYITDTYRKSSDLIAYGGDHVFKVPVTDEFADRYRFLREPYAFSVCRIEPENNIHVILSAFLDVTDIKLVIVGNWNASKYGKYLRAQYADRKNILMLDAIYDPQVLNLLRSNCSIYVHGHSAGGTNPSLVESMHLGLPIVAYDVDYNRNTTGNQAVYFRDAPELAAQVKILGNDVHRLSDLSQNLRAIAVANYNWKAISEKYAETFKKSFGSNPRG